MLLLFLVWLVNTDAVPLTPVPEPPNYILSFPKGPNPMNITVNPSPEKNYFILIGDWGCAASDTEGVETQKGVAKKMQSFVSSQKAKGMNLLFVGTVGDNFYSTGQNCQDWTRPWTDVYGNIATDYLWLSAWGNHDWGGDDPNAMCAWNHPKYIDPNTKIPYAANQLNKDKGGCNPKNYYQPDFGYYYSIPQLSFEWIVIDENEPLCQNGFPGLDYKDCGGSKTTGCNYMKKIQTATESMMKQRANVSTNNNFFIIQHYAGGQLQKFPSEFESVRGNGDYIVWSAGGHTHQQECVYPDNKNDVCAGIMTGGGGHGNAGNLHGFFVIGFDENKKMIQPYKINDTLISCMPPCQDERGPYSEEEVYAINFKNCCNDPDEGDICSIYDLSTCT